MLNKFHTTMPIIKSAKKALRQSRRRQYRNQIVKKDLKKTIKILKKTVGDKETIKAKELMPMVYKKLDKAAKRGLIKKNTASRYKSRLSRLVNKID